MFDQSATVVDDVVAKVVELSGIAIIALGAFGTLALCALRFARGGDCDEAVADIINTVAVEPTLLSVGVLAGIILIRTFLSFRLEVEIEGRLPWERRKGEQRQV